MYCGHCGAAVEDHDQFCRSCGARFVESAPTPVGASNVTGGVGSRSDAGVGVESTGAVIPISTAAFDPPPPTQLIPVITGPGGRGTRPFLIGGAFALIVVAGIVAFFLLRGDDSNAQPAPTGPTSPVESTTTTNPLPSVETTLPVTLTPTTLPVETTAPPPPSATPAPTAPPDTTPTSGTVPINTATIPGATPTSGAPVTTAASQAPTPATTTRPPATAAPATAAPTTAPTAAPAAAPTSGAPTPVGQAPVAGSATVSAIRASSARTSGTDACGRPVFYKPANVLDGQLSTAWMTDGNGGGQYLEFTIAPGAQLTQIGLVPGYAKQDPCTNLDRFHQMRRIVEVRWTFDGGNPITQTLDPESPTMQTISIAATTPSVVRLTITATTDVGTPGLDYSPISEVTLA